MEITIIVNGERRQVAQADGLSLLEVLRDELGVTGPKLGCAEGTCGACTVLLGRRAVTACQVPAAEAAGQRITTVEGLAEDGILHPVQQAWLETGALQCGFCTPGWLTGTAALLAAVPHPDDERIAAELAGHVCRCCTYPRIRRAVRRAAELMDQPEQLAPVPAPARADAELREQARRSGAGAAWPQYAGQPLDLTGKQPETFAAAMPEGLLTAVAGQHQEGGWGAPDDAWVHVGSDSAVTAFTGKVEAGQGTRTALSLLVAEELAVPPSSVRLVMADTDSSPFDMGTFGSRSIPYAAPPLRAAAAAARRVLVETAAERFALPPAQLTPADGFVAGPDGAPRASYGELVAGQHRVELVPPDTEVTPAAQWRTAGRPASSLGASSAVTGAKRFPSDLRIDGMLHGCVLRRPALGAVLCDIDTTAAAAVPGVTVQRDGDFVGVVAPTRQAAMRAVGLIEVDWQLPDLPGNDGLEAYLRAHPVQGEGFAAASLHTTGDVSTALKSAPVTLSASYSAAYVAHVPLEPRSALALWQDGRLTVWAATSTPFRARKELAAELGLAEDLIQVIVPDYGGGFGGKHGSVVAAEAARLARVAGQPVHVQWSRQEEFTVGYLRPAAFIDVTSGATESGGITAWSFSNLNSGAAAIMTPYIIASQRIAYQPASSPLPQGSYRALAATANNFARESHMDELATALGVDPVRFRLDHLDDPRLAAVLEAAAAAVSWPGQHPAGPGQAATGTGIALGFEKNARVATAAQVQVGPDGQLTVRRLVTAVDCGQVIHPDGLVNQVEGAVMMGLGPALFERIEFEAGQITNGSMSQYRVPRLADLPEVEVLLLDQPGQPSVGGGETPIIAVAPAIANAIDRACGVRLRQMPLAPSGRIPLA